MTTILIISLLCNILLIVAFRIMSISHLGVFAPPATRFYLRVLSLFRVRCSVIVYDIRKMHEINAVLGYTDGNILMARLTKVRRNRGDFIGQYGGDEFAIIATAGAASHITERLVDRAKEITDSMSADQREALDSRTAGITDGINIAAAYRNITTDALETARILVDETENLKESGAIVTGRRETTGNKGTLVCGQ
jgi:GGDEF domain-containing protein